MKKKKLLWTSDVREIERRIFGSKTLIWDAKDLKPKKKRTNGQQDKD